MVKVPPSTGIIVKDTPFASKVIASFVPASLTGVSALIKDVSAVIEDESALISEPPPTFLIFIINTVPTITTITERAIPNPIQIVRFFPSTGAWLCFG